MKKSNWGFKVILMILIFLVSGYNIYKNPNDFFKLNLHNLMTIFIALFFAYYMTQKNNKNQKSKEKTELFLSKCQLIVSDSRFRNITSHDDVEYVMLKHRRINNLLTVISDMGVGLDLTILKDKAEEHKNLIGNHYNDIQYLEKSSTELSSLVDLMDFNIDKCIVDLYKCK